MRHPTLPRLRWLILLPLIWWMAMPQSATAQVLPNRVDTGRSANRAQLDSAQAAAPQAKVDSLKRTEPYWGRPQRAALYSALLPGGGQIYNRQWWKVPILYAGLGAMGYLIVFNNREFHRFQDVLVSRAANQTNDPFQGIYTVDQLVSRAQFYRRNRDLSFVVISLIYLLNVADAHVFAHLRDFNVSEDLALHPTAMPGPRGYTGLTLTYQLR